MSARTVNDDARRLREAIAANDIGVASSLIASGAVNLSQGTPLPLICAAFFGRVEILTLLLDAGADIDVVDDDGNSACHAAVRRNCVAALKLLIDRGAKLHCANGDSLLEFVSRKNTNPMTVLLLEAGVPFNSMTDDELMSLVTNVDVLKALLSRNVNVKALRDKFRGSLCHRIVWNAHRRGGGEQETLIRALVELAGIDVNEVDDRGATPFHYAATRTNVTALRVLAELGADIDRLDSFGRTAFHRLIDDWASADSCLEFLVSIGADVQLAVNFAAGLRASAAPLCALLAGGADLDRVNQSGDTARMAAVRTQIALPTTDSILTARRRIARTRLDLVRSRAFEICVGLQPLNLDALQVCEIMLHSCGMFAPLIAFHHWWAIATKVKHFNKKSINQ
jgi:ankyrin repeat protein